MWGYADLPLPPSHQAPAAGSAATDADGSTPGDDMDDFPDLPAPPKTTPVSPRASLGAPPIGPAVAAAAGPRFRPGSRVLLCDGEGVPEAGTVGVVVTHGPDPVYKVRDGTSLARAWCIV